MSQPQRGPPGVGGAPGGQGYGGPGSVRRAREMLESGMVREARTQAIEPGGDQASSGGAKGNSKRNIVAALRGNQKPPPLTISKPTPIPRWPLREEADSQQGPAKLPGSSKGPPPQRPRRPSNVPSLLDSSKVQGITPNFAYREPQVLRSPEYDSRGQESGMDRMEAYLSPPSTGKTPRVSAESDTLGVLSPAGAIPEFPLPGMKLPPAPPQELEEPLSERSLRGPSFPFSAMSYISTIPEESEVSTRNANSFASSMAIPSSWGSERPESDVLGITSPGSTATDTLDLKTPTSNIEGESGLVRQASLGKRGKPFLRTINRSGSGESVPQVNQTGIALGGPSVDGTPATSPGDRVSYVRPSPGIQVTQPVTPANARPELGTWDTASPGDNGSAYSPSDAGAPGARAISPADMSSYSRSGLGVPDTSRYPSDVSGFDAPFMLDQSRRTMSSSVRKPDPNKDADMADMRSPVEGTSSKRRPPRLNIDAVRDAEARGSLTSLPDLIRRATRVATNLERGKTASRLGIMDFLNNSQEKIKIPRSPAASDRRPSEAISGILSAFPPPGATPKGTPRVVPGATQYRTSWPLPQTMSDSRNLQTSDSDRGLTGESSASKQRRCCGISRRAFLIISAIMFILIAVAVIVPVVVVLTRHKDTTQPAPAAGSTTTPAPQSFECSNGGVTVHDGGNFSCVCANGFTGTHCTVAGDGSCVTAAVGNSQKATLGSDLPQLLQQSESNFSIPLDSTRILGLFSKNNVSCTTENALVTFGMSSQKRRSLESTEIDEPALIRARAKSPISPSSDVGNIMVDPNAKSSSSKTQTAGTSTTSAAPGTTTLPAAQIRHILDFSRIAILYIFEMTATIDAAIKAQEEIQAFLTAMPTSNNTMGLDKGKMPPGFVLDFVNFKITLANGTVVGGGTGSNSGGS
ncbi:hypothetical protein AN4767.2 [Paecilomyces variotii No. 5]|uniref:EGF-like domain-containing protein n=1 Tax=Byssochlamys spectabilis (strain No. 5 / NBRC 109023) TaxID=1356009 RepID=V5FKA3_BYSSN|nr:hypothetical protein AN4767.2 [Paecilomyces variotii No. 5]